MLLRTHDQSTRKLIRTVSMDIATEDLDTLRTKLDNSITSCGGYIESSPWILHRTATADAPTTSLPGSLPTTWIVSWKPPELWAPSPTKISKPKTSPSDTLIRKPTWNSLRTEYDRVSELLEQATELDQILALESKLSDLRYQINSYETQLRTYDNLVDYSTVYLNVNEVAYEQPTSNTIAAASATAFETALRSPRFLRRPLRSHHRQPPGSGGPDRHHHRCHPVDTKTDPQTQSKKREHHHSITHPQSFPQTQIQTKM